MPRFQPVRKTDIPEALRGPWRTTPVVRLDRKGQLYFSQHAAAVFGSRRLAFVEFDAEQNRLRFTAVETVPKDMLEDDLFRLTWGNGQKNGCGVAVKSLLHYIGFRPNGGPQALEITAMDPEQHSISVVLPAEQMGQQFP